MTWTMPQGTEFCLEKVLRKVNSGGDQQHLQNDLNRLRELGCKL